VLRRKFGPKREKVTEGWRRLQKEDLHNLYTSPNIIGVMNLRRMRLTRRVACMVEIRNIYHILVENPAGKKPL